MQKLKIISLLIILGMVFFPWKLICIAHPFGHSQEHHEPGKLSPCELRKQYKGKGPAIFPPMHCKHLSPDIDNYQTIEKFQIKPTFQTLAFVDALFEIVKINYPKQHFLFPLEPKCRSATIISISSLRAPPFC